MIIIVTIIIVTVIVMMIMIKHPYNDNFVTWDNLLTTLIKRVVTVSITVKFT